MQPMAPPPPTGEYPKCPECNGTGLRPGQAAQTPKVECATCYGDGFLTAGQSATPQES